MISLSNPTIRYGTSSTELLSLLESGKKEDDVDDVDEVGVGSVSVRLDSVCWLLPPDALFGEDVAVMMSSGSADVVVFVGNCGTADVLTCDGVALCSSSLAG